MTSKTIGSGFRVSAGKIVKRAARMPAGQAANAYKKAAREEKAWKERFTPEHERRLKAIQDHLAAKARGKG
jgi:hypothetical protein